MVADSVGGTVVGIVAGSVVGAVTGAVVTGTVVEADGSVVGSAFPAEQALSRTAHRSNAGQSLYFMEIPPSLGLLYHGSTKSATTIGGGQRLCSLTIRKQSAGLVEILDFFNIMK